MATYKIIITSGAQGVPGQGVPAGGTTGQFLKKRTDNDFDTEWTSSTAVVDSLNDINDVVITNVQVNEVLKWDGTQWINSTDETGTSAIWGGITGTLSNQTDLQTELDGKAPISHTHTKSQISDFSDGDYATAAQGTLADSAVQPGDNVSVLTNDVGYLTSESDPVFSASPAFDITSVQITNWDNAYSWGDHSTVGYLTSVSWGDIQGTLSNQTDLQTALDGKSDTNHTHSQYLTDITGESIKDLSDVSDTMTPTDGQVLTYNNTSGVWEAQNSASGVTDHGALTGLGDDDHTQYALADGSRGSFATVAQGNLADSAVQPGDNVSTLTNDAGYLTSESDPVFAASPANNITSTQITNWDTAYSWGDHSAAGYLTSVSFLDLTDSPTSYTGNEGKLVKVNATGDGLIFGDPSGTTVSWGDIQGTLSNQTDLQAALDGKSDTTHTHALNDLSDVGATPALGDVLWYNGAQWTQRSFETKNLTDVQYPYTRTNKELLIYDLPNSRWVNGAAINDTQVSISALWTSTKINNELLGKADTNHTHTESDITDLDKYTQTEVDNLLAQKQDAATTTSIQTTDGTSLILATITLASDTEKIINVRVHGHEDATDDHIWKVLTFGVKNVGGVASIVGGIDASTGYDAGASLWSITAGVSSGNAIITVTGEAGKTINWRSTIEVD